MYFCYVDESGHCGTKYDSNQPVEVLVGVVSDASKIHKTNREHSNFLRNLLIKHGIEVSELKSAQIFRGRKEWSSVDSAVRKQVFTDLLRWVNERSCKLIVCPIHSEKYFELKKDNNEFATKFHYPYEAGAFNILLSLQRLKYGSHNNKGKTIVIFDEEGDHDKRLIKLLSEDLSYTDNFTQIKIPKRKKKKNEIERFCQIIDIPFFSKSEHSQLIQIADLVAFVVSRYIQLKSFNIQPSFEDELEVMEGFYLGIKDSLVPAAHINPPIKGDTLASFYQEIRPIGWTPQKWIIK
ncbi:MAG TPA: DUF3800 domain-containing protein [Bacteroidales bacterium]